MRVVSDSDKIGLPPPGNGQDDPVGRAAGNSGHPPFHQRPARATLAAESGWTGPRPTPSAPSRPPASAGPSILSRRVTSVAIECEVGRVAASVSVVVPCRAVGHRGSGRRRDVTRSPCVCCIPHASPGRCSGRARDAGTAARRGYGQRTVPTVCVALLSGRVADGRGRSAWLRRRDGRAAPSTAADHRGSPGLLGIVVGQVVVPDIAQFVSPPLDHRADGEVGRRVGHGAHEVVELVVVDGVVGVLLPDVVAGDVS